MARIRILLVDDNRILREGITAVINAQPDMRVVAATGGNTDTLQMAHKLNPHILLIDLGLRNQNGVRIVGSVSRELPEVKVIGMGLIPTQSEIVEFVEAGASGFIMKAATGVDFLGTIRLVAKGTKIIPPQLTGSLFSHIIDYAFKEGKGRPTNAERMTKREREIVALIADGLSNKEIARRLNIATYTVKSHVHNILEKLALRSRMQIAMQTHDGVLS
jgi:DNA-binding NarL/FixJ family response regulator